MGRSTFGDLYADYIAKSPRTAANALGDLRRRRAELAAGDAPRSVSDNLQAVENKIASYLTGFRLASRCEDCGKELEDPVSVERGVGRDCWGKRQRAGQPVDQDGAF
jgi:hypothetical protein